MINDKVISDKIDAASMNMEMAATALRTARGSITTKDPTALAQDFMEASRRFHDVSVAMLDCAAFTLAKCQTCMDGAIMAGGADFICTDCGTDTIPF